MGRIFGTAKRSVAETTACVETVSLSGQSLRVTGWAIDGEGVERVELKVSGKLTASLSYGISRLDVRGVFPNVTNSEHSGFSGDIELDKEIARQFLKISLDVINKKGKRHKTTPNLLPGNDVDRHTMLSLLPKHLTHKHRFYVIPATSGILQGGADGVLEAYGAYESETIRIGIRVPILYMRTTLGSAHDYNFDANFDTQTQKNDRQVVDDNLASTLAHSAEKKLPLLLTLNGGIWGDASGSVPEWDLTDYLEQDKLNCQWNQNDEVMPDDALKSLLGSHGSPELGRSLTFNAYATKNRKYKKRNLQEAAKYISEFSSRHPTLFLGINVDPDLYLNPFFEGEQWYDYNPGTLRQFRNWLGGEGLYASYCEESECDYSHYPTPNLSLSEVRKLSNQLYSHWDEVEPPRIAPVLTNSDEDQWIGLWEQFRRHLVQTHYDEISLWLNEAGIHSEYIFSSQGFMAPGNFALPFAIDINSPLVNYDSGGMSVAGAKPVRGHLGAIVYGNSATNTIRMGGNESLFSVLRDKDPDWAVVESNTADLRNPKSMPDFSKGYESIRHIFNYGARFISPMAWNGSNGILQGAPGFDAFTALRNTPMEEAILRFMYQYANIPRGALVWTFGNDQHTSQDGWTAEKGTEIIEAEGSLVLQNKEIDSVVGALSPKELNFSTRTHPVIIFQSDATDKFESLIIQARRNDEPWDTLSISDQKVINDMIIFEVRGDALENTPYQQFKFLVESSGQPIVINKIILYPQLGESI